MFDSAEQLVEAIDLRLRAMRDNKEKFGFAFNADFDKEFRLLRPSSSGKCAKQLAYQKLFPDEGEELSSRALNVFLLGDVIHAKERALISSVTRLLDIEKEVTFHVDDVVGDIPGAIDGRLMLGKEHYILDIKSTNTRSFKEMVETGPRPDYIAQLNCYMDATGIDRALLWLYNKDTSFRHVFDLVKSESVLADVRSRFRAVHDATPENLPERMYSPARRIFRGKPTNIEYLPWQCRYCSYTEKCWASEGFVLGFDKGKPSWEREVPEEKEPEEKRTPLF